ncbi:MAG: class I SAM-dependent methyltransferase [Candidatus Acidiferrales bacterium]
MKWLFLDAKQRLRRMAANPGYAAKFVYREATWADERFLARITGERVSRIRRFIDEPARTPEFMARIHECEETFRTTSFESADLYAKKVLIQYAIVRAMKPDILVETGVANGVSSAHVLLALHKNQRGALHSIEIGDSTYLPPGREPGWVVPDWLRGRWQYHRGDSTQLLPKLLRELPPLDLFTHDSLHTYEHMKFEFEEAFPFLRPGGILIADDALWNESFWDFARAHALPNAEILHGVGVLRKEKQ